MRTLLIPLVLAFALAGCDSTTSVDKSTQSSNDAFYANLVGTTRSKAMKGDASAQFMLGDYYLSGYGPILKDQPEGMRWLRKSAEHGYYPAMLILAKNYEKGIGVVKDDSEAYVWHWLSVEAMDPSNTLPPGKPMTPEIRDAFSKEREAIAKRLSPLVLQQAQARARKLLEGVKEWRLNENIEKKKADEEIQIKKLTENIKKRMALEEIQARKGKN